MPTLLEKDNLDPIIKGDFGVCNYIEGLGGLHTHDFYEVFLINTGRVLHLINGEKQVLYEGALVFIRPNDIHNYELFEDDSFQLANLGFSKETADDLFEFLCQGIHFDGLLNSPLPITITLSVTEKEALWIQLQELNFLPFSDKIRFKTRFRGILADIFTRYFLNDLVSTKEKFPLWLLKVINQMKQNENFTEGLSTLQKISGRTPSYICYSFRRYLGASPTEYINRLRLNYAANLLSRSDEKIVNIAMESGFDNLSHFYHLFKKEYGFSPADFRKEMHL